MFILMTIFYASEWATQIFRLYYWEESYTHSFDASTTYRWLLIVQMLINILCAFLTLGWLHLTNADIHWKEPTPLICGFLMLCLLGCQCVNAISDSSGPQSSTPSPEASTPKPLRSRNSPYLVQTALDFFACGFLVLYYSFDRSSVEFQSQVDERTHLTAHDTLPTGSAPITTMAHGRSVLSGIICAGYFHVVFIIISFAINSKHEISMCEFSIDYLISIVENILLFEILHLAIDRYVETKRQRNERGLWCLRSADLIDFSSPLVVLISILQTLIQIKK